jgi:hypothetical protein
LSGTMCYFGHAGTGESLLELGIDLKQQSFSLGEILFRK